MTQTLLAAIQSHADAILGSSMKLRKNAAQIELHRQEAKNEIAALRQEADKYGRMFKSLYESLVSGLISADEYRDMRGDYETKTRISLERATDIEKQQAELDEQIIEYKGLADVLADAQNTDMTAALIDRLVDRIRIFSDRSIEVDFKFTDGFNRISEVTDNG